MLITANKTIYTLSSDPSQIHIWSTSGMLCCAFLQQSIAAVVIVVLCEATNNNTPAKPQKDASRHARPRNNDNTLSLDKKIPVSQASTHSSNERGAASYATERCLTRPCDKSRVNNRIQKGERGRSLQTTQQVKFRSSIVSQAMQEKKPCLEDRTWVRVNEETRQYE